MEYQEEPELKDSEKNDIKQEPLKYTIPVENGTTLTIETQNQYNAEKQDTQVQSFNTYMNFIDPPKDLKEGGFLTKRNLGNRFTATENFLRDSVIKDLFGVDDQGTKSYPKGFELSDSTYVVIGDDKDKIVKSVNSFYGEQIKKIEVIRAKHATGHNPRPDAPTGLYLVQDNGSTDVVIDPKLLIIPGSILDPAGKTKVGAINLVTGSFDIYREKNIQEQLNTLEKKYFQSLTMEGALTNAKMTYSENDDIYTLTLKLTGVQKEFTVQFDGRTYQPVTAFTDDPNRIDNGAYFLGNDTKNEIIANWGIDSTLAANRDHVKKFILMKELGDTLQVEWLNKIFTITDSRQKDEDGVDDIARENTIISTSDTIVYLRALINKIGVIYTDGFAKTSYILPRVVTAAAKLAIEKRFIYTIQREVCGKNEAVIKTIEEVLRITEKFISKPTRGSTNTNTIITYQSNKIWIDGLTWSGIQIKNAVTHLKNLLKRLKSRNQDLSVTINLQTVSDEAKKIAEVNHFISPFVYKGENWKYINTVSSIAPLNKINTFQIIPFKAANFDDAPFARFTQKGGGFFESLRTINIYTITLLASLLASGMTEADAARSAQQTIQEESTSSINPQFMFGGGLIVSLVVGFFMSSSSDKYSTLISAAGRHVPKTIIEKADLAVKSTMSIIVKGDINVEKTNTLQNFNLPDLDEGGIYENIFLYCFMKLYHPEIFKYAYVFKQGIDAAYKNAKGNTKKEWEKFWKGENGNITEDKLFYLDKNYIKTYFNEKNPYYFNSNGVLSFINDLDMTLDTAKKINETTIACIQASQQLLTIFPGLKTPEWAYSYSILHIKNRIIFPIYKNQDYEIEQFLNLESSSSGNTSGGGGEQEVEKKEKKHSLFFKESYDFAFEVAIDLYEIHYSLLEASVYSDTDIDDLILERLVFIEKIITGGEQNKYTEAELEILIKELSELPKVKEKLPQAEALLKKIEAKTKSKTSEIFYPQTTSVTMTKKSNMRSTNQDPTLLLGETGSNTSEEVAALNIVGHGGRRRKYGSTRKAKKSKKSKRKTKRHTRK